MPDNKPIDVVRSTDIAGSYVAYTFADGHVETDPPGRPLFKEDLQRNRRIEVSKTRSLAILAAEKTKGSSLLPSSILRNNADVVNGSVLIMPYLQQIQKISNIAETSTAAAGQVTSLLQTVPIGGKVIGDNAGAAPEYNQGLLSQPVEDSQPIIPYYPNEV